MKGKPEGKPSGNHPFDRGCAEAGIKHRLAKPFHPQTNGMVERFKRGSGHRLFASHADRDAFFNQFAHDYNHTRLKCLSYLAPKQVLVNLTGPNTCAGPCFAFAGPCFSSSRFKEIPATRFKALGWDKRPVARDLMSLVYSRARWQMPPASCWLVWKSFADCELGWTNLPRAVRCIRYRWSGFLCQNNEPAPRSPDPETG